MGEGFLRAFRVGGRGTKVEGRCVGELEYV